MKKNVLMVSLTTLVAAGLVLVAIDGFLAPDPAEAGRCLCLGPIQQTQTLTGHGVGCGAALGNLYSQLYAQTGCAGDGTCFEDLVITRSCYNDEPQHPTWNKVDGYLRFQCRICF